MENKKKGKANSTSSISSQLFGSQESSSSNDVFASIFPPKGLGINSGSSEVRGSWQKETSGTVNLNAKQDNSDKYGNANKEKNSGFQQEAGDPCYLSSSIYYGGQEIYSIPPSDSTSASNYPTFKKDGGEDDPNGAARGNWWQGSLYY